MDFLGDETTASKNSLADCQALNKVFLVSSPRRMMAKELVKMASAASPKLLEIWIVAISSCLENMYVYHGTTDSLFEYAYVRVGTYYP
eukprot:15328179-Ditylum_brightwellii.AAC.2